MRSTTDAQRTAGLMAVAVLAVFVPAAAPVVGPDALTPPWVAAAWLGGAAGALAGWGLLAAAQGRALALRAARVESRLRRCERALIELREAAVLPAAGQAGGSRLAYERRCERAAKEARSCAQVAATWKEAHRRGFGLGAGLRLGRLESRAEVLEGEVAALEERLAGVREELAATATALAGVADRLAALCAPAPEAGTGLWCEDVRARLDDAREALFAAESDWSAGRSLEALREARRLRSRLAEMRRTLEAREASLAWLRQAAAEGEGLARAAARLTKSGYRGLPAVPVGAIATEALQAIAWLREGAPARATAAQAALRVGLERLRLATIGREELRTANARRLDALAAGLRVLQAGMDGLSGAGVRERYAPAAWAPAVMLGDRLTARARDVEMLLRRAGEANHLDVQDFDGAARWLAEADGLLTSARQEAARCAAAWRRPAEEHARLEARLAELHGEVAATYLRARAQGLAPGSGLEGLLVAARAALRETPLDPAHVARPLHEAEVALRRFEAHLSAVERGGKVARGWKPGHVTITPIDQAAEVARRER